MTQAKLRNIRVRKRRDAGPARASSVPTIPSPPATTVGVPEEAPDDVVAGAAVLEARMDLSRSVGVSRFTVPSGLFPEITRLESTSWSLLLTFGTSTYWPADPIRPVAASRTAIR